MHRRVLRAVLEAGMLLASALAAADTLVLNDGSKVEGAIVEETGDTVVLKVKFGQVPYKKTEIKEIQRAGGAAPLANAADLRDVLVLKTGEEHRGLLVQEGEKEVTFDLVMSGKSVSKTLLSQTTFQKAEIAELRKLTERERTAARQHLANVAAQARQEATEELNVTVESATWALKDGKKSVTVRKVELENFTIASDTDEDFLRRAAFRLGKAFAAYKQHFGVDRNQATKVRVLILNSMAEFYDFVGGQIKNPAFYQPSANLICAGCDVARYQGEIAEIRKHHAKLNTVLEDWKFKLQDARAKVAALVGRTYERAKGAGGQGRAALDNITAQQREWQLRVGEFEKEINRVQAEIDALNRRNDLVFNDYTRLMFATLYHEGFHAFLDNFLFPEGESRAVPRWLNEGLAQYFEMSRMEGSRFVLGQEDRARMALLRQWKKDGKTVPLDGVLTGKQEDYMVQDMADLEHSTKHYLEAWCLVHLLGEKGRLQRDLLREFVKQVSAQKPPLDALLALAGMTRDQLQAAWDEKLRARIVGAEQAPAPK